MSVFFETSTRKLLTEKMTSARLGASAGTVQAGTDSSGEREWK
jgi:aspartate carbamoyltransferase catalytic subunit